MTLALTLTLALALTLILALALTLTRHSHYSSYEPELFPGLIYRMVSGRGREG